MSLKEPKYIENEHIPWALIFNEHPQFYIYKIENEEKNIRLHYYVEGRGVSLHVKNHQSFQELPSKIEVISGGWYGTHGRWSPLERYSGTIICKNVTDLKKISDKGTNYKFIARQAFLSNTKILKIESEPIGIIEIKCKTITPQDYEIQFFCKIKNTWVPRESVTIE